MLNVGIFINLVFFLLYRVLFFFTNVTIVLNFIVIYNIYFLELKLCIGRKVLFDRKKKRERK